MRSFQYCTVTKKVDVFICLKFEWGILLRLQCYSCSSNCCIILSLEAMLISGGGSLDCSLM